MFTPRFLIPACLLLAFSLFVALGGPVAAALMTGLVVGYLFNPLVEWQVRCGFSRTLASFLPITLAVGVVSLILVAGLPFLAEEISQFIEKAPGYRNQLLQTFLSLAQPYLPADWTVETLLNRFGPYGSQLAKFSAASLQQIAGGAAALMNILTLLLIIPIVAFFMLQQWPIITKTLHAAIPPTWQKPIDRLWPEIDQRLSGFFRGQVLIGLFLAVFYGIGLALTDLELGWALGIVTGLLSIVPMIGGLIGMLAIAGTALLQFQFVEFWPYLTIIMVLAGGSAIENFILSPILLGKSVKLHPLWVLLGLLAGGRIAGMVGVILAIPALSVAHVILPEVIAWWHHDIKSNRKGKRS